MADTNTTGTQLPSNNTQDPLATPSGGFFSQMFQAYKDTYTGEAGRKKEMRQRAEEYQEKSLQAGLEGAISTGNEQLLESLLTSREAKRLGIDDQGQNIYRAELKRVQSLKFIQGEAMKALVSNAPQMNGQGVQGVDATGNPLMTSKGLQAAMGVYLHALQTGQITGDDFNAAAKGLFQQANEMGKESAQYLREHGLESPAQLTKNLEEKQTTDIAKTKAETGAAQAATTKSAAETEEAKEKTKTESVRREALQQKVDMMNTPEKFLAYTKKISTARAEGSTEGRHKALMESPAFQSYPTLEWYDAKKGTFADKKQPTGKLIDAGAVPIRGTDIKFVGELDTAMTALEGMRKLANKLLVKTDGKTDLMSVAKNQYKVKSNWAKLTAERGVNPDIKEWDTRYAPAMLSSVQILNRRFPNIREIDMMNRALAGFDVDRASANRSIDTMEDMLRRNFAQLTDEGGKEFGSYNMKATDAPTAAPDEAGDVDLGEHGDN